MSEKGARIIIAGGGTGGHLFPGLSVAKRFVQKFPGSQVLFVGSIKPIDRKLVTENGFDFVSVPQAPMPRSVFSFQMLKFVLTIKDVCLKLADESIKTIRSHIEKDNKEEKPS
jgi:UDP-N-acetylglucosamine:LPS N-acetylglucosamine transferase